MMKYIGLVSLIVILLSYSVLFMFNEDAIKFWCNEDGFFEYSSAIWYLFASILLLNLYIKDMSGNNFKFFKTNRNIFFILLGLLFFTAFGEEISWGQRIFNIETPEKIKEVNIQGELNIHNLVYFSYTDFSSPLFTLARLFAIFWLSYCVLIPLFGKLSKRVQNLLKTINLPLVPISIGLLFSINYLLSHGVRYVGEFTEYHRPVEIKEANTAFLFFIVALLFTYEYKKESNNRPPVLAQQ